MDYRCISLRQPWASLLGGGVKKYETRSWQRAYRGLVFVHASKEFGQFETQMCAELSQCLAQIGVQSGYTQLPKGGIIGAVRVVEIERTVKLLELGKINPVEMSMGDYSEFTKGKPRFGWRCEHPVLFKTPIPCSGQLGLYRLPDHLLEQALAELNRCTNQVHLAALLKPAA